jgi:hypothetical protein
MEPQLVELISATNRNKKALESVITAMMKYNTACSKAAATLNTDLENCKTKLNPKNPSKSIEKK